MDIEERLPSFTLFTVATTYAVLGSLWILFSDRMAEFLSNDLTTLTLFQTAKGLTFVLASAVLVYGLSYGAYRRLERTNEDLQDSLRHSLVLQRVLRHNLRNSCQVIQANAVMLSETDNEHQEITERIQQHTERLITLSEKSHVLRDVVIHDGDRVELDLGDVVATAVETVGKRFPNAQLYNDCSGEGSVLAHPRLHRAIMELIENGIEASEEENPTVWIDCFSGEDTVTLAVSDEGGGIPSNEAEILERGAHESPLHHSQGIGVWLVRMIVENSAGTIDIAKNDRGGSTVRVTLDH